MVLHRKKNCLAVFGHIFVVIGTTIMSIERRNVENELKKKSISRPPYRRHMAASFRLYIDDV